MWYGITSKTPQGCFQLVGHKGGALSLGASICTASGWAPLGQWLIAGQHPHRGTGVDFGQQQAVPGHPCVVSFGGQRALPNPVSGHL